MWDEVFKYVQNCFYEDRHTFVNAKLERFFPNQICQSHLTRSLACLRAMSVGYIIWMINFKIKFWKSSLKNSGSCDLVWSSRGFLW